MVDRCDVPLHELVRRGRTLRDRRHVVDGLALESAIVSSSWDRPPAHRSSVNTLGGSFAARSPWRSVRFNLTGYGAKISALAPFVGTSGWLRLVKTTITSLEAEDRLDIVAMSDGGFTLDDDLARKLFTLDATIAGDAHEAIPEGVLTAATADRVSHHIADVEARNAKHYDDEAAKLDQWAEDMKFGLDQELKELRGFIIVVLCVPCLHVGDVVRDALAVGGGEDPSGIASCALRRSWRRV